MSRAAFSSGAIALVFFFGCSSGARPVHSGGDAASDGAHSSDDGAHSLDDGAGKDAGGDVGVGCANAVSVEHEREFRGVWVASVYNINFPSRAGLSAEALKAELEDIVTTSKAAGFNAIVFQVRPEGDALYQSELEPWSRYLTGQQGGDPGYDPLAYIIDLAHAEGIELHAWFNPYRARRVATGELVAPHICATDPNVCVSYGTQRWMDPGIEKVQDSTHDVIMDVADRYDIDGVHFDDYFYPYPEPETPFDDAETYAAYVDGGGTLSLADWRRDNVNTLIARLRASLSEKHPDIRFGISPFGIYRPGMPEGITGLDQYASLYADPVKWLAEDWLDYNSPQLYWPTDQTAQAFEPLLDWWTRRTGSAHHTFAGHFLNMLGMKPDWTVEEFRKQWKITRAYREQKSLGGIWFHIGTVQENRNGIADVFANEFYPTPVAAPVIPRLASRQLGPPKVEREQGHITVSHPLEQGIRTWAIYEQQTQDWTLHSLTSGSTSQLDLAAGVYAISAIDKAGVESLGCMISIP